MNRRCPMETTGSLTLYYLFFGSDNLSAKPRFKQQCSKKPGHPLAQRPHTLGILGLDNLKYECSGTLRPHPGSTLDVEGQTRKSKKISIYPSIYVSVQTYAYINIHTYVYLYMYLVYLYIYIYISLSL